MRALVRLVGRRDYPPPTLRWALVHLFCAVCFIAAAACWVFVAAAPQTVVQHEWVTTPHTSITSGNDR
jgi:hypothetical protein